ncbi:hypothetical protein GOP47_0006516 [Adiantum capillus-veneris]|uniref:Uncharacterized protein n=1 Tax=Adiantum capillus-veneris TaxID=13818 RepID=A0A9D4V3K9_ADICA|nr:hypothetical protein GOP47_0006516 [Adiantum capillus-veneris]
MASIMVLSKFFKRDFVTLAVNLPPSCTFWSAMEEEIEEKAACTNNNGDTKLEAFLEFLSTFFSSQLLEEVKQNFGLLMKLSLGLMYTLRKGRVDVAKAILKDIHENPSLSSFDCWVSYNSHEVFSSSSATILFEDYPTGVSTTSTNHGQS